MTTSRFRTPSSLDKLKQQAKKTLHRSFDKHIKLAVTGFSGSGKTAFITALIKHLTTQTSTDNLPFLDVLSEGRLVACRPEPQKALAVPTFDYQQAISCLLEELPTWPASTKRINTLTLAFRYHSERGLKQHLAQTHTLYLELYDYPGEWLMDLPLLKMTFSQWCEQQFALLKKPKYQPFAQTFLQLVEQFDSTQAVDENKLKMLAQSYHALLAQLQRDTRLSNLQPGRALIPGDLEGAPILLFFPVQSHPNEITEHSQYQQLVERFEAYKKQVVAPFYKDYFCQFDRQVVLVDLLGSLSDGYDTLKEQEVALKQILAMFSHGKSGLLSRLFNPKIDKVLFAANKCDGVLNEQQSNLTRLLNEMLVDSANELRFNGVTVDTMSLSSVRSVESRAVKEGGEHVQCIYGKPVGEQQFINYVPPTPPDHIPKANAWPQGGFEFIAFEPLPAKHGNLSHIRLDHALQFLIGDKLR
ncbi:YcjX family protein [Pseudoalteromonas sp. PS5]|uniref:YcjX family protein n=1 Tax=Pseudoalteromonas sp. PS5 TaxID=1437473 RepID=UPI000FFEAAC7|nr:YcjX family protein [Pseudoalteromonas sp. PS5]RXF03194.1 YcjX family protein [Pseudoalteromonas sp. PS5]